MADIIPLPPGAEEKLREVAAGAGVVRDANSEPLPGAAADAFAIPQHIDVKGRYQVRPFYDADFEIMKALDHPLRKMVLGGEKFGEKLEDFSGMNCWVLCWLMTHDCDHVDALAETGVEAMKSAAKKEFSRLPWAALIEIQKAVFEQFGRSVSTLVGFSSEEDSSVKKNSSQDLKG